MKRKRSVRVDPDVRKIEDTQLRCPGGHPLPNRIDGVTCTPVYCPNPKVSLGLAKSKGKLDPSAGGKAKAKKELALREAKAETDAIIEAALAGQTTFAEVLREAAKEERAKEIVRLGFGLGRHAAMRQLLKVPDNLDGEMAEQWVQRRALALSVDALSELERQLKFGDDEQRRDAARDILDMNGMRRRESSVGGGATILLINPNGQGALQVPWAQRVPVSGTLGATGTPRLDAASSGDATSSKEAK